MERARLRTFGCRAPTQCLDTLSSTELWDWYVIALTTCIQSSRFRVLNLKDVLDAFNLAVDKFIADYVVCMTGNETGGWVRRRMSIGRYM